MKVNLKSYLKSTFFAEAKVSQKADTLCCNGPKTLTKCFVQSFLVKMRTKSELDSSGLSNLFAPTGLQQEERQFSTLFTAPTGICILTRST